MTPTLNAERLKEIRERLAEVMETCEALPHFEEGPYAMLRDLLAHVDAMEEENDRREAQERADYRG